MSTVTVKLSSTSELLRESTFEAERLIELHSLHEYKERQIARLKAEEKTLYAILSDQREIIKQFGATEASAERDFKTSEDSANTPLPKIQPSISTQCLFERDNSRPKLYPSRSAAALLAQLSRSLTDQAAVAAPAPRRPAVFAQSRQNFFVAPPMSSLSSELSSSVDFESFFKDWPLSLMSFTGYFESGFPSQMIMPIVESFTPGRRNNFITCLVNDINNFKALRSVLHSIQCAPSLFRITDICELDVAKHFGAKRSCFLMYDAQRSELVFLKEKIELRFAAMGLFQKALYNQSMTEVSPDDPGITSSDKAILQDAKVAKAVPILSARSKLSVDGLTVLFDAPHANLLSLSLISRSISLSTPLLSSLETRSRRAYTFSATLHTFVDLCTAPDLATLVSRAETSFTSHFSCEAVRFFKVSSDRTYYRELTRYETLEPPIPISRGIVGASISSGRVISLGKPQFADNYDASVDCIGEGSFASSLLVSPLGDSLSPSLFPSKAPAKNSKGIWAIALYNKREQAVFSDLDVESLSAVASHLLPVLQSSWRRLKLRSAIGRSEKHVAQAAALVDVIASQKSPTDLTSLGLRIGRFFRENSEYSKAFLYTVDHFRRELIGPNEVIPIKNKSDLTECVQNGRSSTTGDIWPVLSSSGRTLAVVKLQGGPAPPPIPARTASSLSLLATFRSSISTPRLLAFASEPSGQSDSSETRGEGLQRMIAMWQRVAAGVVEGSNRHREYNRQKQLAELMALALYENWFDASFRVWQECQFLVDDFQRRETSIQIKAPQIDDIVYASTSELSDRAVRLIKALQSLNAVNPAAFPHQTLSNTFSLTLGEDDSESFYEGLAVDMMQEDDEVMIHGLVSIFLLFGVCEVMCIGAQQLRDLLRELRGIHPPRIFSGWRLAVDHVQFAAFLLKNTRLGEMVTREEVTALFCFLLSVYADPREMESWDCEKFARYSIETGGTFSSAASFFTSCAWCEVDILGETPGETKAQLFNTIDELEGTSIPDTFYGSSPIVLLCWIARQSHYFRERVVTQKWIEKRREEEWGLESESSEVSDYVIQYEMEMTILPLLQEIVQIDPAFKDFIERVNINVC